MTWRLADLLTIYDGEPGPAARALSTALAPAGTVYGGAMRLRSAVYRLGVFSVRVPPCRVVSVGALGAGGSGKTQVVAFLSALLASRGVRGAVIHGGYGGAARGSGAVVRVREGTDPAVCGDEARFLAGVPGGLPVYAAKARYDAVLAAVRETGARVCVLDDAAQHLRIGRAWDIFVADPGAPFANGRCIPAGPLREPPAAIARANVAWFVSHRRAAAGVPPIGLFTKYNDQLRIVSSVVVPAGLDLATGGALPADSAGGARVVAFCGIGRPHRFFDTVRALGPAALETMTFPDHHRYTDDDAAIIAAAARTLDADLILTTAKDHARSSELLGQTFPYAVVRVSLETVFGGEVIEEIARLNAPERRVSPR